MQRPEPRAAICGTEKPQMPWNSHIWTPLIIPLVSVELHSVLRGLTVIFGSLKHLICLFVVKISHYTSEKTPLKQQFSEINYTYFAPFAEILQTPCITCFFFFLCQCMCRKYKQSQLRMRFYQRTLWILTVESKKCDSGKNTFNEKLMGRCCRVYVGVWAWL